jgi:hypothetical protein
MKDLSVRLLTVRRRTARVMIVPGTRKRQDAGWDRASGRAAPGPV